MSQTTYEELAREGDVDIDIAVHSMFRQEVYAELFAGFGEAPLPVKGEDVCEDAAAFIPVDEIKELESHVFGRGGERAVDGGAVIVVDARVLVMEGTVEDATSQGFGVEHAGDERSEFNVTMVEGCGDGSLKLELVGLEAGQVSAMSMVDKNRVLCTYNALLFLSHRAL